MDAKVGTEIIEGNVTVYQMRGEEIEVTVTCEEGKREIHTYSNDEAKSLLVALARLT